MIHVPYDALEKFRKSKIRYKVNFSRILLLELMVIITFHIML